MIPRLLEPIVFDAIKTTQKIILILGARQVGKTTLLDFIQKKFAKDKKKLLYLNCDIEEDRSVINTTSLISLQNLTDGVDYLFIDETQRLDNPGLTLKIIHDNIKKTRIIATGSSSFELKNRLSDALTGRYLDFSLYPLSFKEMMSAFDLSDNPVLRKEQADSMLESILLYGFYPEVFSLNSNQEKIAHLRRIVDSYLFMDILTFQKVRNSQAIKDLTKAIAYQIGSEVNENELASRIKIDRKTVASYLQILEKAYVIVRLSSYSKNPRREIGRKYKIYFTDIGVRNALIGDFNPVKIRDDLGGLWENFLIIERLKRYASQGKSVECNFWRTYGGAEVDFIERLLSEKKIHAFEFKYAQKKLSKGAGIFTKEYNISVDVINKDNYLEFV